MDVVTTRARSHVVFQMRRGPVALTCRCQTKRVSLAGVEGPGGVRGIAYWRKIRGLGVVFLGGPRDLCGGFL